MMKKKLTRHCDKSFRPEPKILLECLTSCYLLQKNPRELVHHVTIESVDPKLKDGDESKYVYCTASSCTAYFAPINEQQPKHLHETLSHAIV